jgi:hypothetical protein
MRKAEQENQLPINNAVDNLKTRYDFVQSNEISTFLRNYPSLIADLNTVYETKSQYFKELPMTLYYISETGSLDSATLAAYIEMDILTEETKTEFFLLSQRNVAKNIKRSKAPHYSRHGLRMFDWQEYYWLARDLPLLG